MSRFLVFIVLCIAISCTSPKEKLLGEITMLEQNDSAMHMENSMKLQEAYLQFADSYPDDDHAPLFLFKLAQHCNVRGQYQEAVSYLNRIQTTYSKHEIVENALFLKAYILENNIKNLDEARLVYQEFLKTYPQSDMAEDAELSLTYLGKSPEEIWDALNGEQKNESSR